MKVSAYKSYDDLPLFLNAAAVAKALGVSPSSGYGLMHEPGFPVRRRLFSGWNRTPAEGLVDEIVLNTCWVAAP